MLFHNLLHVLTVLNTNDLNAALLNPFQSLTITTNTRAAQLLDFNSFVREVLQKSSDLRVGDMKPPGAIAALGGECIEHSGGRFKGYEIEPIQNMRSSNSLQRSGAWNYLVLIQFLGHAFQDC